MLDHAYRSKAVQVISHLRSREEFEAGLPEFLKG